jgi:hypothetical protein
VYLEAAIAVPDAAAILRAARVLRMAVFVVFISVSDLVERVERRSR